MKIVSKTILFFCAALLTSQAWAFEALPKQAPAPKDNPITKAKIELGKQLFFDPRLSKDGTVSCNSCHNVMASGTDNRPVSVGVDAQKGGRSAPTVWNAAFLSTQFWDGRAASLEDQAKGPILNPIEMGMPSADEVVARIKGIPGYVKQFKKVFGGKDPVTYDNLAKAIATFERTLITPDSKFDRYMRGDKKALSKKAKAGMKLVKDIGCTSCHTGPNFSGPKNLKVGEGFFQKFPTFSGSNYDKKYNLMADLGLYSVTNKDSDKNMWRVPTWRNVAVTAPYFHNGSVQSLDEAVKVMAKTQLNKDLTEQQVGEIVAFLNSLTGKFPKITMPRLPDTPNTSLVN
ncbi:MAG: cytochrome-c peroxidase [Gammaproteobacteria bacterium]|nr:cytochrome-c peroxidase [Gammaproteobacteria bacterium]MDH5800392.1 cytochrome-c peroxidase [Gammaproteobacteria bacterium]